MPTRNQFAAAVALVDAHRMMADARREFQRAAFAYADALAQTKPEAIRNHVPPGILLNGSEDAAARWLGAQSRPAEDEHSEAENAILAARQPATFAPMMRSALKTMARTSK
jgi:hypothetical protein